MLAWVIPSGQCTRVPSDALAKNVPIPGSYALTPGTPQGLVDVILALGAGFDDPDCHAANAIDVARHDWARRFWRARVTFWA